MTRQKLNEIYNQACDVEMTFKKKMQMRPMAVTQVIVVTWVCADYNSYLESSQSHKNRGSDCWTR